jgi:ABC-type multidrug transport system permease subunit
MIVSQFFGSAMGFVSVFSSEKAVFLREYSAGYYSLLPYYLSKTLMELPIQILSPVMFVAITYFLIGLQKEPERLFAAALACVMTALSGMAVGNVAGAAFNGIGMALAVLPLLLLPLLMFSGLIINMGSIPFYFRWFKHISPMRYGYEALMKNEYKGLVFKNCDPMKELCKGEQVLKVMSMSGGFSVYGNIGILFAIYMILMIGAFFALLRVAVKIRY